MTLLFVYGRFSLCDDMEKMNIETTTHQTVTLNFTVKLIFQKNFWKSKRIEKPMRNTIHKTRIKLDV